MNALGEIGLLIAFIGSAYAAFACAVGWRQDHRAIRRGGDFAAAASVLGLSAATAVLAWALLVKDFRFAYVAEYSNRLLPWHYSLSALWVGQAGSLLLWAWFMGVLALAYRFRPRRNAGPFREPAFAVLMAYLSFLTAVMLFGADPMRASLGSPQEGAGLSPLLQHPAMLIHPPVVFLGYAGCAIPFAVAVAALLSGRLDATWIHEIRPWALFAWIVLGGGILLGAVWAYEELGWGGYWAWDPVENGSLVPWLTGTALIHVLMAWQYRGVLKKTALALAIATFGLCNFATFLTRSGVFSSLHAFSESPVGWLFLAWMLVLAAGGFTLLWVRRRGLTPDKPLASLWAREAFVLMATIALGLLAVVALAGTLAVPLSGAVLGRPIVVGAPFYSNVLIPTGLLLLATTGAAPLLRWGKSPSAEQRRMLLVSAGTGTLAALIAFAFGIRHPIALAVTALAAAAASAVGAAVIVGARRRESDRPWLALLGTLRYRHRQYAGFLVHVGFVLLAVGVTGSSLGARRHEIVMHEGETVEWAGRSIHFVRLIQRESPDKLAIEAKLEILGTVVGGDTLFPAQHLHRLQEQWTTEVAIHSTWVGDLYVILRGGEEDGSVSLTLIENPLMRWIWLGGWVIAVGGLAALGSAGRRSARPEHWPTNNLPASEGDSPIFAARESGQSPSGSSAAPEDSLSRAAGGSEGRPPAPHWKSKPVRSDPVSRQ